MKNSIESRIARLMEQMATSTASKIRVIYSDGRTEHLTAGECIDLIMGDTTNIDRFEGGRGCGCLTDLLNGLLEI